jgi:colanic acid/amylovoran biosynthesis glycosyltransferase
MMNLLVAERSRAEDRRPATVAYLLDRFPQRSETFVSLEIDELRRQGQDVLVIALGPGDLGRCDGVEYLDRPSGDRRRLAFSLVVEAMAHPSRALETARRVRRAGGGVPWRLVGDLVRRLRDAGADHIHAHFALEAADVAWVLAAATGTSWSFTAHAWDLFVADRRLALKVDGADRVVTVCEYNRRWIEERFGSGLDVAVVVCGVRVPPLDRIASEVDVVAVGRLVEKKGFDVLVEALPEVAAAHPGLTVEIIGEGPEHGSLEKRIVELGLESVVRLRGAMPHEELLRRVAASRLLCLPARIARDGDRDSMPVVIKDAMARARPVVATAIVGIPEMVDDSNGRLVPPDDSVALASALLEVLEDEHLAERLGTTGRATVTERFRLAEEVAALRAVFDRCREDRV